MALNPGLAVKLIFVLGLINLVGLLLVALSCRCVLGSRLNQRLAKSRLYMKFYQYHCYYWWLFILSVLTHATIAITTLGIPFK